MGRDLSKVTQQMTSELELQLGAPGFPAWLFLFTPQQPLKPSGSNVPTHF